MRIDLQETAGLDRVPPYWDSRYTKNLEQLSKPIYQVKEERDVWMTLRDGTKICVDIFRPDTEDEQFPALLSWAAYGKTIQSMKRGTIPPSSLLFDHSLEAGDIDFYVKRGYGFIIPDPRGIGKSEGEFYGVYNPQEQEDVYDVIEWMAELPWCDGNVAMNGYSYFGIIQMLVAAQQPPHLKCIMPLSFTNDYYQHGYYGGVGNTYMSIYWELSPANNPVAWSTKLYDDKELQQKMADRLQDPDIAVNSYFAKILTTWPPKYHTFYLDYLLHPHDGPFWEARSAKSMYDKVKVPVYMKCGWSPNGRWSAPAFEAFNNESLNVPKRMAVMEAYNGLELPYRFMNEESLRWYDHWLKGVDTGIMDEPPIKLNIIGAGYRYEKEWPLARTEWRKLYLRSFGKLRWEVDPEGQVPPDSLTHLPPNISTEVKTLTYTSDILTRPMEFTGPIELHLFAAIDAEDANFIVKLWDILPGGSRLPVSRWGALRASHKLDTEKSLPGRPVHDHTQSVPVVHGEISEYVIEVNPIGMVFGPGHRIEIEIMSADPFEHQQNSWTGKTGFMGPIPSANTIHYKIYRDADYPSYILMPYIRETPRDQWLQPMD
ncbi:CocE/NonD family hydrolase [Paenibacillus sp. N1-5-1-14]|uniref:CocE/NonD family hydrolase n=1 Tax=Paenibacillus radicibacter TaxID=2972488 RepID=UPI002159AA22|nr:CocE/NonD family hydrolase [Paenibacillus radicibacter]MCR8644022.1 CocE/NonD family hydrolase [Paenibacillus radicibacter]